VTLDPDSFRAVLGRFARGVTVVTTVDDRAATTA
jgi:flavin reductase (DIM6/NTAB) family NADH-FMN oxidoreductase RutF